MTKAPNSRRRGPSSLSQLPRLLSTCGSAVDFLCIHIVFILGNSARRGACAVRSIMFHCSLCFIVSGTRSYVGLRGMTQPTLCGEHFSPVWSASQCLRLHVPHDPITCRSRRVRSSNVSPLWTSSARRPKMLAALLGSATAYSLGLFG